MGKEKVKGRVERRLTRVWMIQSMQSVQEAVVRVVRKT